MAADTKHITVAHYQPYDGSVKIWRYLDLPRLIDLLQTRSLHFARVSSLDEDSFEGSFTKGNLNLLRRELAAIKTNKEGTTTEEYIRKTLEMIIRSGKDFAYINCWHASNAESVALWKQYGTEAGAIAIQSTYEKLAGAFPSDPEKTVYMGMIQYKNYTNPNEYINFPSNSVNSISLLFHKRIEYQHEKEVRALMFLSPKITNDQDGIKIGIDVDKAIEEIRMRPRTPKWITEVVANLIKKYDLHLKVLPSQLDEELMP